MQAAFLLLAAIWTALPASAATFNVTSASCIGSGSITLDGLYQYGLSFHCEANGWSGKANGYCNTVGEGNIIDLDYREPQVVVAF